MFTDLSYSYSRDPEAAQRITRYDMLPAQKSGIGDNNYREEMQRGFRDDGRMATGELHMSPTDPLLSKRGKESEEDGLWIPPSIPWLRCERDAAIQAFVTLNETFNIQNLGGEFDNFDEA